MLWSARGLLTKPSTMAKQSQSKDNKPANTTTVPKKRGRPRKEGGTPAPIERAPEPDYRAMSLALEQSTRELNLYIDQLAERKRVIDHANSLPETDRRAYIISTCPALQEFIELPLQERNILRGRGSELYNKMACTMQWKLAMKIGEEAGEELARIERENSPLTVYKPLLMDLLAIVKSRKSLSDFYEDLDKYTDASIALLGSRSGKIITSDNAAWSQQTYGYQNEAREIATLSNRVLNVWNSKEEEYSELAASWESLDDSGRAQLLITIDELLTYYTESAESAIAKGSLFFSDAFARAIKYAHELAAVKELQAMEVCKTWCFVNKQGQAITAVMPILPSLMRANLSVYLNANQQ